MKEYNLYKKSTIEWIQKIPKDWHENKLGNIGKFSSSGIDKLLNEDEPEVKIINYTNVYGNKKQVLDSNIDYMVVTSPQSRIDKHTVKKGDLIFTPSSETKEDIGLSALVIEDLDNTAYSYHVLRYQFNKDIDLNFKKYLCNNHYVLNYYSKNSRGTTRQTLGRDDFNNTKVILPPKEEQTAIATFLDQQIANIDQQIADKKRLLELYEEEKTGIINQAVTKGLNPDAPMKESGIEWIGEIPDKWEVLKFKYLAKIGNGKDHKDVWDDKGMYPIYGSGGIFGKSKEYIYNKPSVLLGRKGTIDKPLFVDKPFWAVDTVYYTLIDESMVLAFYFFMLTKTINFNQYQYGSAVPSMNQETLKNILFPLPSIEEQKQILKHIKTECALIDNKKECTTRLIELLKEYKQALISEAVTGKIKVV